jgi:predicted ATP-grasp superfamily ATP-dependent carboligase
MKTRPVRIYEDVHRRFAAACKLRDVTIQDAATAALLDKLDEWRAEEEAQEHKRNEVGDTNK